MCSGNNEGRTKFSDNDSHTRINQNLWEEEGGGNSRLERRLDGIRKEGEIMEEGFKTPERVQRLRALWELGVTFVRPRWRSKGGLGTAHYGISSSSMLSLCSNAEFNSDIVKCNNRLRVEENDVESVKLWGLGK